MKPSQLSAFLTLAIQHQAPVLITGAPGVGKSDIVAQAATAVDADLIVEHPVVSDPTDYKGLPFATAGHADFLPFGSLRRIIEAKQPTVYFLDDLGQAPPAVQAACMQLLLARRINGHQVAECVTFVAATNRRQDRAGVTGMLEPVKSRFASIVNLEPDLNDTIQYAIAHNWRLELISFLKFKPNLLCDFRPSPDLVNSPSPRTWANVNRLMGFGFDKAIEFEVYSGAVGEAAAADLVAFLKLFRTLPNPDMILLNPDTAPVPTEPGTLYALAGALAKIASEQTISRLIRYYDRLPVEFNVFATTMAAQKCPAIVPTSAYIGWCARHTDVLM